MQTVKDYNASVRVTICSLQQTQIVKKQHMAEPAWLADFLLQITLFANTVKNTFIQPHIQSKYIFFN